MKIPSIRSLEKKDNPVVKTLITKVMTEYDCVGEGYSINDPELDNMYEAYSQKNAAFFVIENNEGVLGCAGIAPLKNGEEKVCELRKMYFYPKVRGLGLGQKMLDKCLSTAIELGYEKCYLETVARMNRAKKLYLKNGFTLLNSSMGQTGHSSCDSYYVKVLKAEA